MIHPRSTPPPDAPLSLLRLREVMRRTGKSKSDIYRGMAAGRFPRPVEISERSRGWVEQEVGEWISERISERNARSA